jgi:hypothetical protein
MQTELLPTIGTAEVWHREAKPIKSPDLYALTGERKLGKPGWRWFTLRALDDGNTLAEGDVPLRIKRTGRPEWPKGGGQSVVINDADLSTTREVWEQEHGKCGECGGDGQVFAQWNIDHGYRYRTCTRCNGVGAPPETRIATQPTMGA